jgi:hypothetical protein
MAHAAQVASDSPARTRVGQALHGGLAGAADFYTPFPVGLADTLTGSHLQTHVDHTIGQGVMLAENGLERLSELPQNNPPQDDVFL